MLSVKCLRLLTTMVEFGYLFRLSDKILIACAINVSAPLSSFVFLLDVSSTLSFFGGDDGLSSCSSALFLSFEMSCPPYRMSSGGAVRHDVCFVGVIFELELELV